MTDRPLFRTVLVANRGEIAVRVIRTLRRLGIRSVAVHSDADAGAVHVLAADEAVRIGPAPARESYLDVDAVVGAAVASGADAVHPGYGFLAENAEFAEACAAAGIVFVGPTPGAIRTMGDKIAAKRAAEAAGVPVVPGVHRRSMTDDDLAAAADRIGYPVLLKPSAGGGGKGMHRVDDAGSLAAAIATARREAVAAFGSGELLVERFVDRPRHIEVQLLADAHGGVVHLGERECSLQRRHQKVIEEAPSPLFDGPFDGRGEGRGDDDGGVRARIGEAAVRVARACGYVGAGTVEFVVGADRPEEFFFLEMNTRLQVEHPVTELVTGVDLVEEQLRCAAGEPLRVQQENLTLRGHAIEARVYAEDPARGFLPSTGEVVLFAPPDGPGVRVDAGVATGSEVGPHYDPMLAKIVAWGPDRPSALRRLDGALARTALLGPRTNVSFLRAVLADPDVVAGRPDTGLLERRRDELLTAGPAEEDGEVAAVAALVRLAGRAGGGTDPFDRLTGWRIGGPAWTRERLQVDGGEVLDVAVRGRPDDAEIRVGDGPVRPARVRSADDGTPLVTIGGRARHWWHVARDGTTWLARDGAAWAVRPRPVVARRREVAAAGAGILRAPMPGTVTAVHVGPGQRVAAGQPVVVVEAMKMEHVVRAPVTGRVSAVHVTAGATVPLDAALAEVSPDEASGTP